MDHVDVGIIGGGVHGASAAFHLGDRGVSTMLFERGDIAGGPTGRSSAVCRAYYTNPFLAQVARESLDLLDRFAEVTGGHDAGYHRTGGLFLHGPEDIEEVRRTAQALTAIGTITDALDVDALADRFPAFDLTGVGIGGWERDAGYADPVLTTQGLVARARDTGVEVRRNTEVARLEHHGDRGTIIHLADGTSVGVDRLLIAAGPWSGPLAAQVGAELPLTAERHVVATYGWGPAARIEHVFADIVQGYYAKPERSDHFIVGPLTPSPTIDDPDAIDDRLLDEESEELATKVIRRLPGLEEIEPRGGWASLYDVSPDWQPVIGEIADGVFIDAGTSGHGFKLAPGLGRYVADLVLGDPDPGLEPFTPHRFATGAGLASGWGDARILG